MADLALWSGPERHQVVGNVYIHTFSDSVDHGGNFDIYLVGLGYEIKISISQGIIPSHGSWPMAFS